MQQVLATFLRKVLVILLVSFISLSSFAVSSQPSFAATSTMQEMDSEQSVSDREQAYEEQIKAEKNLDKVFEENVKEYRKENPEEGIIEKTIEGVEKVADKVTGKK
ncbi:hypothetical protein [Chlorogloea sp. CCALA 695]|uniref:hypothetical protein n=1 Tax=Chlorogloea sp. CCALA 695 TaxID=2107693 RepID=UPI000D078DCB|nr:hypothetical protein [Chlorogloea sp. CCALA 695]PSB35050.1 hypothetical protein C7B70_01980 [Chlorogloea sp. CCALA 695]